MEEQLRSDGILDSLRNQIRVYVMTALSRKGLRPDAQRPPPHIEDDESDEFVGLLIVREFLDSIGLPHSAGMLAAESGKDLSASRFELLEHAGWSEDDGRPALLQIMDRCRRAASAKPETKEPTATPSEPVRSSVPRATESEPTLREVSSASTYSETPEEPAEPPAAPSVARVQRHSGMIRSATGWESREDDSNDFLESEETEPVEEQAVHKAQDLSLEELADMDDDELEDDFQLASAEFSGRGAVTNPETRPKERSTQPEVDHRTSWDEKSDSFESTSEEIEAGYDPSQSIIEDPGSKRLFQRGKVPAEEEDDYGEDFEESRSLQESIEEEISVGEEGSDDAEAQHHHVDRDGGGGLSRSTGGFLKTLPRLEQQGDEEDDDLPPRDSKVSRGKASLSDSAEDAIGSDLEALSVGGASDDGGFFDDNNNQSDKSW